MEKSTEVTFDGLPQDGTLTVVINEKGTMKELNRGNNRTLVE